MNKTTIAKKAIFSIDLGRYDEYFIGYHFGNYWNGWGCPVFDTETTKKALECLFDPTEIELNEDQGVIIFKEGDETSTIGKRVNIETVDGVLDLWDFTDFGFSWTIEEDRPYILRAIEWKPPHKRTLYHKILRKYDDDFQVLKSWEISYIANGLFFTPRYTKRLFKDKNGTVVKLKSYTCDPTKKPIICKEYDTGIEKYYHFNQLFLIENDDD